MNEHHPSTPQPPHLMEAWFQRINYERQAMAGVSGLKLDAIERLLAELGCPQEQYPIVHVAGTKGKGSVTRLVAGILQAAGYRTGCYTSPHLDRVHQRYEVNGQEISDELLNQHLAAIWPFVAACDLYADQVSARRLTFFDIATALGFWHFAAEKVDASAIEVGLGGRLDSTNVCRPVVSVITSISFDHTRQLGNTLAAIAAEKAGIIKPQIPVVCGVMQDEPRQVIEDQAAQQAAPLLQLGRDFGTEQVELHSAGSRFDFWCRWQELDFHWEDLQLNSLGRHQVHNAALALMTAALLSRVQFPGLSSGVKPALAEHRHPGRIEIVRREPTVVLDVAHNEASLQALLETVSQQLPAWNQAEKKILILAISRDKNQLEMLRLAVPKFDLVIMTRFLNNPRATPPQQLQQWAEDLCRQDGLSARIESADTPQAAWDLARVELGPRDLCCIAGSLFLAAELRPGFVSC